MRTRGRRRVAAGTAAPADRVRAGGPRRAGPRCPPGRPGHARPRRGRGGPRALRVRASVPGRRRGGVRAPYLAPDNRSLHAGQPDAHLGAVLVKYTTPCPSTTPSVPPAPTQPELF